MNISLTPRLEALIRQKVESGRYHDASEVLGEALRLLEERDRHERFKAAIAHGIAQAERGEVTTWTPDTMRRLSEEAEADERLGRPISDDVLPDA